MQRCKPLEGESQSQLVGDAERGQKSLYNKDSQAKVKNFTNKLFLDFVSNPSQNFLAENFTLPQGEGDYTELDKDDYTELDNGDYKELVENSKINFKITQLKRIFKNSTT